CVTPPPTLALYTLSLTTLFRSHPVTVNAAPILDGDGLLGAVLVLREVAAQRQSERAMREAYTELDQRVVRRTAALERASAALRRSEEHTSELQSLTNLVCRLLL